MPGFSNGTVYANNVDFSGGSVVSGQVTTDGQLLIGSTAAPHIKVGTLTSLDSSVTITPGSGTIDLSASGASPLNVIIPNTNSAGTQGEIVQGGVRAWSNYGTNSLYIGNNSGNTTNTGNANFGAGTSALSSTTTGSNNTCVGYQSGQSITDGFNNFGGGYGSLNLCTSGYNNTAAGVYSLGQATLTGRHNCAFGFEALKQLASGDSNIAIGRDAGFNYTSSESNNIIIGDQILGTASENNTTRIGNGQTQCFIAGISGVSVSNPVPVFMNSATGQLGTSQLAILSAKITLTSAQIKLLHSNPIVIVPAQGANTVVVPVAVTAKMVYGGTNVFVAGASQTIVLYYNTGGGIVATNAVLDNASIVSSASNYNYTSGITLNNSSFSNIGLSLWNPVATEISGNAAGDNSIIVSVAYYVATLT